MDHNTRDKRAPDVTLDSKSVGGHHIGVLMDHHHVGSNKKNKNNDSDDGEMQWRIGLL